MEQFTTILLIMFVGSINMVIIGVMYNYLKSKMRFGSLIPPALILIFIMPLLSVGDVYMFTEYDVTKAYLIALGLTGSIGVVFLHLEYLWDERLRLHNKLIRLSFYLITLPLSFSMIVYALANIGEFLIHSLSRYFQWSL